MQSMHFAVHMRYMIVYNLTGNKCEPPKEIAELQPGYTASDGTSEFCQNISVAGLYTVEGCRRNM